MSTRVLMSETKTAVSTQAPDPGLWVDRHGDYLFKYAVFRLRDQGLAEDVVQETLLAALQAYGKFEGRGAERTWLVGILKHKITDCFRRMSRERTITEVEGEEFEHAELFMQTGEWVGHWASAAEPEKCGHLGPHEWGATPEAVAEQNEFWMVFSQCLQPLPQRIASAFTLREVDGLTSEEICEILGITVNNLWVMLHRARAHLRRCIEVNWFTGERAK